MHQPPATAGGSDTFFLLKLISTTKRILRGEVSARLAALEAARRLRILNERRRERAEVSREALHLLVGDPVLLEGLVVDLKNAPVQRFHDSQRTPPFEEESM